MEGHVRVGIAGTGFIAGVHARALRVAGVELAGVASATYEMAKAAAPALGAERAFASAGELIADPSIDAIHVCTPNNLHLPLAQAAIAAGKHLICEKPLALDASGAAALASAAEAAGVQAAVPFVYRYYPTVREARELIAAGDTGPLRLLHGSYLQDWLLRPEDDNWRVDAELGGASRAFADIGSHWCDLAEFVSGHRITRLSARTFTAVPERVRAEGRKAFEAADEPGGKRRPVTTEDAAIVSFETDGGAMGSLVVSQVSAGRKNRLWIEFDGTEAALAFDQEQPEGLWYGRRDRLTLIRRDAEALTPPAARFAVLPPGHPQGYGDCFDAFIADFYEAVRTGTPPDGMPAFADGVRASHITEAVLASAREQAWVDVRASVGTEVVAS